MVIDELIPIITEKFKQGERRNEIKEDLMNEGYYEEDVEDTVSKIQHEAIKQLPGISWIYQKIELFESKQNLATPRMTLLLMAACIGFLVLVAVGLYLTFDPLGSGASSRDDQRQTDITIVQNALTAYYQKGQRYPNTLDQLVPAFLSSLPRDPQTGAEYSYKQINGGANYELCASFELQNQQCVSAASVSNIPVVATDTPIPQFVPQSGSGTSSSTISLSPSP